GCFFKQGARGNVVLWTADTLRHHQTKLILRLCGICLRRFRQQGARLDGVRCWTTGKRCKIRDATRVAGFGRALEKLACFGWILGTSVPGAEHPPELDHRGGLSFVGSLAPRAHGLSHSPLGGIGATDFEKRPP